MNRIALSLAALLATSGTLLANDFSGNLAFPTAQTQTSARPEASDVDRMATFSIVKTERPKTTPVTSERATQGADLSRAATTVPDFR